MVCCLQETIFIPFLQNAGQKVNFLFALVAALYLTLLTVDFARYGGVVAPSWITAAFAIALGGWIGCRRSERLRTPRVFFAPVSGEFFTLAQ